MTQQKRLETKESTKYSVLEITTTTLFPLTTSDNLQDSSIAVADPWFASSRETQHFFWLLWHTAIFDERGILKERDSKEPALVDRLMYMNAHYFRLTLDASLKIALPHFLGIRAGNDSEE
ncbi:hypothetical protein pdam_00024212 [Pocillopora damicornis]|uniref:Uncharacterized protein n=1 Tax=Pocillopora damicornis TaxID=46731 RepID=A0A3M6V324_POCDA|nr:hypothetical protein pdam_00024212 [Pocillopora damicornis]